MTEQVIERLIRDPTSPFYVTEEDISWSNSTAPHHQPGNKYRVFPNGPQILTDLYDLRSSFLDKDFLVYEETRLTFREVFDQAAAIGSALASTFGIKQGDRVCMLSRNYPEWIIVFVAATSIGAVAVPMNSWWKTEEIRYGLENSGAKVVVCDDERYGRLKPVLEDLVDLEKCILIRSSLNSVNSRKVLTYELVLESHKGDIMPKRLLQKDDNAVIMYTSGTTGHPKGVVLTHRGITSVIHGLALTSQIKRALNKREKKQIAVKRKRGQQAVLLNVPLFHATGLHSVFLCSFLIGRKIAMMYKWNPEHALEIIEREKITTFTGVPTMIIELMNSNEFAKRDLSSLGAIGGGGAPPPPSMLRQVKDKLPAAKPSQGYGMTETNALITTTGDKEYFDKPLSCGRPLVIVDVEIWNEAGKPLPPGTPGRIMARGPNIMKEYWRNPEATAQTISPTGWLDTGDIGKLDDDGYLYIMDRAKDMIIRGGENISCAEVEAAIYDHPGVLEAAVFGISHETLGEEVAVAIHPRKGHKIDLETVRKASSTLADFKRPTALFLWESEQLPRGATGKILKRKIREEVERRRSLQKSKM